MNQLSLYPPPKAEPGFIIDATFIIGLGRRIDPPELRASARAIVDSLVTDKRVASSYEVYRELNYGRDKKKPDEVCILAEQYKDSGVFIKINEEDQENIALLLQEFPTFLKYDSERPDADPWLVVLAMRHKGWTIVSRDGDKDTPGTVKMKQVCKHYDIPCINEYEFLKSRGWQV